MAPSPLSSISVDSRPLLRVYYSQPPTPLRSPSTSLLSLRGFCPRSQERSKSFTDLQSARAPQNKGERRKQDKADSSSSITHASSDWQTVPFCRLAPRLCGSCNLKPRQERFLIVSIGQAHLQMGHICKLLCTSAAKASFIPLSLLFILFFYFSNSL